MSSLLTFQLIQQQQQQQQQQQNKESSGLPSPPSSFCGEDTAGSSVVINEQKLPPQLQCRRDSLQTVFNDMSLQDYSTSLPENYTIDHSSHATGAIKTTRKISSSFNPSSLQHTPIATATAAATGGLTIRNNNNNRSRQDILSTSISNSYNARRKSRGLSESLNGQYRCNDCGKSYKHPNCLQKHRWEHSEEWEITKKLPLTKHQQVQMLEAAAILVGINKSQRHKDEDEDEDEEEEEQEEEEVQIDDEEQEEESIVIDDDEPNVSSIDSSGIFMDDL